MAFFKNLFLPSLSKVDATQGSPVAQAGKHIGPETLHVKMDLEERMQLRRELVFETIRVSLSERAIAPHSYRIRVMRTDKRGHCFVAMLDMSPTFMSSPAGQQSELAATAALLAKNAETKYGLSVGGVYWRVDETLDTAVARWARPSVSAPQEQLATTANPARLNNTETYGHPSAEEIAALASSWKKDIAVHIGNRTYATDLAPLAEERVEK